MRRQRQDFSEPQDYSLRLRRRPRKFPRFFAGALFVGLSGLVCAQMLGGPEALIVDVVNGPAAIPPAKPVIVATSKQPPLVTPLRRANLFDPAYTLGRTPVAFGESVGLRNRFAPFGTQVASATEEDGEDEEIASGAPVPVPRPDDLAQAPVLPTPPPRPDDLIFAPRQPKAPPPARIANAAPAAQPPTQSGAPASGPSFFEKLFGGAAGGRDPSGSALAYAAPQDGAVRDYSAGTPSGQAGYDRYTAVYDISAKTVYLPGGAKLEAHSGLGEMLDDPRSAPVRMRGVTPPALYDLREREALFHGVRALRLTPLNSSVHGRSGLLAHTFMLGPNGQSNGCVSFRNYESFLHAYLRGEVKRLAVVAKL